MISNAVRTPDEILDALRGSDVVAYPPAQVGDLLRGLAFVRVRAMRAWWRGEQEALRRYVRGWVDVLSTIAPTGEPVALILQHVDEGIELLWGTAGSREDALRSARRALHGAVLTRPMEEEEWLAYPVAAIGAGVPAPALPDGPGVEPDDVIARIMRAVASMPGALFGIVARPVRPTELDEEIRSLELMHAEFRAAREAEVIRRHPRVERADAELSAAIALLLSAVAEGAWDVLPFVVGSGVETVSAVVAGAAGSQEDLEPFRMVPCRTGGVHSPGTTLPSSLLARLLSLPRAEAPGYRVLPWASFGDDPPGRADALLLGDLISDFPSEATVHVSRDQLARHAFVAGHSGSGKTNTVMSLLRQLHEQGVPFLVIEPAKSEYASLAHIPGLEETSVLAPGRPGDSLVVNPFHFDARRVGLHEHVGRLLDVFVAACGLFPPLNYALERVLYAAYEEKGWRLSTETNPRGIHPRAFPKVSGVYRLIDPVVEALGYDTRVMRDVQAALKTRIGALRLGSRGRIFDGCDNLALDDLLARPVVIELGTLSGEEVAFAVGILALRLYEHLQALPLQLHGNELRHVTVFEEAHRLLSAAEGEAQDDAGTRKRAVEALADMLAEVRAYGEGIIIADQIPGRLHEAAIKNTDLKVMHRLPGSDDRARMGGSMAMSPEQQDAAALLAPGEAVVFAGGFHSPYLIKVTTVKDLLPEKAIPLGLDRSATVEEGRMDDLLLAPAVTPLLVAALWGRGALDPHFGELRLSRHEATHAGVARLGAEHIGGHYALPFEREGELEDALRCALEGRPRRVLAILAEIALERECSQGCPTGCVYGWAHSEMSPELQQLFASPQLWVASTRADVAAVLARALLDTIDARLTAAARAGIARCAAAKALHETARKRTGREELLELLAAAITAEAEK